MEQTTPTRASLDTVEALLAQQRLAQEQLGRDLQAARTEQAAGPLSAPSFVLWGPPVWFALSALMLLAIVLLVFVKIIQPRLRGLQRLRHQERTRAEEMFVEHASLVDGYSRGVLNDALAAQREAALVPSKAADADVGMMNVAPAALVPLLVPMAAQDVHRDLDLDLDLSLGWDAPVVASQSNFMSLPAQTAAAFMPEATQPLLLHPSLPHENLTLNEPASSEIEVPAQLQSQAAPLASQSVPLEAHWQIQFDLAQEYVGMGLVREAAMLYADLVAQGEPDVARRADALLSALTQSR